MKFIPYGRQFIDENDINAVHKILKSDFITTGPMAEKFEKLLCRQCKSKYAVCVSSGTAALHISSLSILKPKDRVLVTANTFLSTVNSIVYAGGIPVFVDIDKEGNIDLEQCIEILNKDNNIKALYAVHFTGNPVNQEKLEYIKEKFGITILEDCAHSLGAYENNINAGSCTNSDVSILSFHPVKHITTGEGGAVTTNSKNIYQKLLLLKNSGVTKENLEQSDMAYDKKGNLNPWYYEMQSLGFNYRITDFQCALGISQMDKLSYFLKRRKKIAKKYDAAFKNNDIIKPLYRFKHNSAYHLYVVRIDFSKLKITKAEFFNTARNNNVGLQVHYIPVYKQPYYRKSGYSNVRLENNELYYAQTVSIPIYPALKDAEQDYVIEIILKTIEDNRL